MHNNIYLQKIWTKKYIHKRDIKELNYSHIKNYEKMKPRQIVWHLLNNINEVPICLECSNDVKWYKKKYFSYCSLKCSTNSEKIKNKIKQTNLKRYDVENPSQSEQIKEKQRNTNLEKYGVENSAQFKNFKEKQRNTNLEKYGVENPMKINYVKDKIKQTNLKRYGVRNSQQKHYSKETKEILFNKQKFNDFMKDKTTKIASNILSVYPNTILNYIKKYNTQYLKDKSNFELEMKKFLEENNISFIQNDRKHIKPKELDFYLPYHSLAIECNGDYWHSDKIILKNRGITAKQFHQQKTNLCKEKGIKLLHISESDWNNKRYETNCFILSEIHDLP